MIAIVCDDKRQKSTDGENHRTRNMECLDLIYDALLHQTGAPEDFFKRTTYWIVWNLSMLRVIPPMRTVWSWIWISKHGIQFLFNREVFLGYPCDSWSWPPNVNLLPGDISQPGRIPPWLSATSIVNMTGLFGLFQQGCHTLPRNHYGYDSNSARSWWCTCVRCRRTSGYIERKTIHSYMLIFLTYYHFCFFSCTKSAMHVQLCTHTKSHARDVIILESTLDLRAG